MYAVIDSQTNQYFSHNGAVIFLDARQNNIPATMGGRFSYVSGFSPVMIQTILGGKDGYDLMLQKLNSERYTKITA